MFRTLCPWTQGCISTSTPLGHWSSCPPKQTFISFWLYDAAVTRNLGNPINSKGGQNASLLQIWLFFYSWEMFWIQLFLSLFLASPLSIWLQLAPSIFLLSDQFFVPTHQMLQTNHSTFCHCWPNCPLPCQYAKLIVRTFFAWKQQ